jgi:outer membrane protein
MMVLLPQVLSAQPLRLRDAIEQAWQRFPTVEAARAELRSANAAIRVSQDAYLPHASLHGQVTRATRNNVLGMVMPNQTIAPITGLAFTPETGQSAFGTSVGMLLRWEAYDFGTRRARVEVATARQAEQQARVELVRYELADAVANRFFQVLALQQAMLAAEASAHRWKTTLTAVQALVDAGLRPGADASRLRAELVRSQAEVTLARQQHAQSRAELGRLLADPLLSATLDSGFAAKPYTLNAAGDGATSHPLLELRQAEQNTLSLAARAIEKEWRPKIELYSLAFGRGSGARIDGSFRGGAEGLYPDIGNWGVGASFTLDLFERKRSRSRLGVQVAQAEAATAREAESALELQTLIQQARIALRAAQEVATQMPEALDVARELETQSQVRYRAGLTDITELADAQRTLRQAEVETAVSKIEVWRAAFGLAAAQGNLSQFLEQIP